MNTETTRNTKIFCNPFLAGMVDLNPSKDVFSRHLSPQRLKDLWRKRKELLNDVHLCRGAQFNRLVTTNEPGRRGFKTPAMDRVQPVRNLEELARLVYERSEGASKIKSTSLASFCSLGQKTQKHKLG